MHSKLKYMLNKRFKNKPDINNRKLTMTTQNLKDLHSFVVERPCMVRWVFGSILHNGPIELLFFSSQCSTTQKRVFWYPPPPPPTRKATLRTAIEVTMADGVSGDTHIPNDWYTKGRSMCCPVCRMVMMIASLLSG